PDSTSQATRAARAALGSGREIELLPRHGSLVHRATFYDGEDRHAPVISARSLRVLFAATHLAAGAAGGSHAPARRSGDRHGIDISAELEIALGELVKRALILKEYDLTVGLAARLGPDAQLSHRGITCVFSLPEDAAGTVCSAHAQTTL